MSDVTSAPPLGGSPPHAGDPAAAARAVLPALAAYGLPGAPDLPPLRSDEAQALVTSACAARLDGVLLSAATAGDVHLPASAAANLRSHREDALWRCLRLEHRLLAVDDVLGAHAIPFVVLKGPAAAHLDLPDPAERTWSDVDVLVGPEHVEEAVAALAGAGWTRKDVERRPGWDRRFVKSVELVGDDLVELDLHRTLAEGVYGERLPLDRLHQERDALPLGGRSLWALSAPARLLHAAYHAVLAEGPPTWANRRELAHRFAAGAVPVAEAVAEAERWGGTAVLHAAVELVRRDLVVSAPPWFEWADRVVIGERERRLASRMRHGDAGIFRSRMDLLGELSMAERVRYLYGLVLPAQAETPSAQRWRRWAPQLLRRAPR